LDYWIRGYSGFRSYEVHLSPLIACGEGVGGGVFVPHNTGKCCIVKETASLLNFGLLIDIVPKARIIVNNRFPNDNYEEPYENVSKLLQNSGIDEFLSPHWLPFVNLEPLDFTSDKIFSQSLRSVLDELDM
jgi:hypothetical protein